MIIVDAIHAEDICRVFAETYRDLPGTWTGITDVDVRYLLPGPGDTSTEEGYMQRKMYDVVFFNVCQEAVYLHTDGISYGITTDADRNLILAPVDTY